MAKINVSASIMVPNGPQIPFNRSIDVDAYDKIEVSVKAGAKDSTIELQPAAAAGQVQFLAIVSDWYGPELSFTINAGPDKVILDQPILCMGTGGVGLFDSAPKTLLFSNATTAPVARDANIQILIGRDATP